MKYHISHANFSLKTLIRDRKEQNLAYRLLMRRGKHHNPSSQSTPLIRREKPIMGKSVSDRGDLTSTITHQGIEPQRRIGVVADRNSSRLIELQRGWVAGGRSGIENQKRLHRQQQKQRKREKS